MSQYDERKSKQNRERQIVNFTAKSFKKYDSVKIVKFVDTLQAHNLQPNQMANEVQSYFNYHSERKQNVLDCLRD